MIFMHGGERKKLKTGNFVIACMSAGSRSLTWLIQEEVDLYAAESELYAGEVQLYADEAESSLNIEVPLLEEMSCFDTQLRELKDQCNDSEQKLLKLEKTLSEISMKKSGFELLVCLLGCVVVLICLLVMFLPRTALKA
ncbi:unnamed protein product [Eruca vesicaria subsp. sativa]|uniref:Transmembrane protein n=1 Tax=Eruca vesicaria subsp. sativa TaxID=29727 RepID=A0ABC8JUN2_ERUVS|nr:unnamed protein product [Eruca vesicaria subsp. sativa]